MREELAVVGSGNRQKRQISSHPALFLIEKCALKPITTQHLHRAMASEGAAVAVEGAVVGAGVAAGASCRVEFSPLETLAQVGTVREGGVLRGGGRVQLLRPGTPA